MAEIGQRHKNLVLTIAVGESYQQMAKYTHPTIKAYAERIGADFLSIDESMSSTPHWEKFRIFYLLNRYERILYLDTDLIVRDDCPNLFNVVPKDKLGMFNEAPFTDGRLISMRTACEQYDTALPKWNGKYYNTGVMVISRCHKYLFKKPGKEAFNFYEQGYLNLQIAKSETPMFDLPYPFNRMTCMDVLTGEERFASYIVHYAGYPSLAFVLGLMPQDIERWRNDGPDYKYKRHLLIDVQGGLGDQVCAEPALRFLKEHVYPDDDVNVVTHFPRLFQHLDLSVYLHEEFEGEPDAPYYHVISLPGPETLMWRCVSNLLCHTIDYVSMALLRRTLPVKDKRVRLDVTLEDVSELVELVGIRNLDELVLVHPGRHWESKTFPVEWWQAILDGLCEAELPICLIGKEEGTRGTIDIEVRESVIDTRDLLDLGSLIALISQARVLVSNDSGPVHIAGAFDNYIILIPSCKHPDHILPFRNGGSQSYRAKALYKKLTLDACISQPTAVHGASGESVAGDILDYLPDPGDVVSEAVRAYHVGGSSHE